MTIFRKTELLDPQGGRYYFNYEEVVSVEYMRNFAGKSDVFKMTSKDGEVTFYRLNFGIGICPDVFEGKISDGEVDWGFSQKDLYYTFKGFRERGIVFENDYYLRKKAENRAREQRAILQMQLLKEYEENVATLYKEYEESLQEDNLLDEAKN